MLTPSARQRRAIRAGRPAAYHCRLRTRSPPSCSCLGRQSSPTDRVRASHRAAWQPQEPPSCAPRSSRPGRCCLPRRARGRRKEGSALDQKGKRENQGFAVLATRKPSVSNRTLVWCLLRTAARTSSLSLRQEPPRITRKLGSPPPSHANPSAGAPS